MIIAVISDVHSNLAALLAVVHDICLRKVDEILCLGDTVGYFAHPGECLDLLRFCGKPIRFVKGNHEDFLRDECGQNDMENDMAQAGIRHADRMLSDEQYQYLHGLPRSILFEDRGIAISHDTFTYPGNGKYVVYDGEADSEELCYQQLQMLPPQFRIAFLGHIHIPYFYEKVPGKRRADFLEDISDRELPLLPEARYLINPGSVGQPRDHDNRAAYGLLNLDGARQTFLLRRLTYAIEDSIEAVKSMRISDEQVTLTLQRRLRGGW